jgi:hypothetical protein
MKIDWVRARNDRYIIYEKIQIKQRTRDFSESVVLENLNTCFYQTRSNTISRLKKVELPPKEHKH